MGELCFGRNFVRSLQGSAKGWFDDVPAGYLNFWAGRGVCDVVAVWQGTGVDLVGSGHGIGGIF